MACSKLNSHGTLRRLLKDNLKNFRAKFSEMIAPFLKGDKLVDNKSPNEARKQYKLLFEDCAESNEATTRATATSNNEVIQPQEAMKMIFSELFVLFAKDFIGAKAQKPDLTASEYLLLETYKMRKWKPVKDILSAAQIITEDQQLFEYGVWLAIDDERLPHDILTEDIITIAQALFPPLKCKTFPDKHLNTNCIFCPNQNTYICSYYINILPVLNFESQIAYVIPFKINDNKEVELMVHIFPHNQYEFDNQLCSDSQQINIFQRNQTTIPNDDKVVIRVRATARFGNAVLSQFMSTEQMAITMKLVNKKGELADEGSKLIETSQTGQDDCYDIAFPKAALHIGKDTQGYINIHIKFQPRHRQVEDKNIIFLELSIEQS